MTLAPDPGDDVARARRLLPSWLHRQSGSYALLARTNRELLAYAAVAREMSVGYDVAMDGLLLGDEWVSAILDTTRSRESDGTGSLLLALRDAAIIVGAPDAITTAVLAWAAAFDDVGSFTSAIAARFTPEAVSEQPERKLTLATVHGTKGLEWDHVACIGFDDGAFPSARTLQEASEPTRALEEERRLAYVAWTRARTTLTIVYDPSAPSLFLRDAFDPAELV